MKEPERRSYPCELRVSERGAEPHIIGHAAVFNTLSEDLGGFREQIDPGAFNDTLDADVRALKNHDPNMILGRTKAGTLTLSVDELGLRYDIQLPKTTFAADLIESVRRGDISQSSFAFRALDDKWNKHDGQDVRTIVRAELIDVSPVTYPAYNTTDTSVARRSLEYQKQVEAGLDSDYINRVRRWEFEQAEFEAMLKEDRKK